MPTENLIVSSEAVDSKQVLCKEPAFEIRHLPPATQPQSIVRATDLSPVIDKLSDLAIGEGLELVTDLSRSNLSSLRASAMRRGFNVSLRETDIGWRIFKLPLSSSRVRKSSPDTQAAYARFMQGETLESLARERGMSRQGLDDKFRRHESFNRLASGDRAPATDEFLAPYLAAVKDVRSCFVCGSEGSGRRQFGLCSGCRSSVRARATIASRIRTYKKTGNRHYARQASSLINKLGIKPEELQRA